MAVIEVHVPAAAADAENVPAAAVLAAALRTAFEAWAREVGAAVRAALTGLVL